MLKRDDSAWDTRNKQAEKAAATFQGYLNGEESAPQKTAEKKQRPKKIWLLAPLLIVVALIGGGLYWYLDKEQNKPNNTVATSDTQNENAAKSEQVITAETKQYASQNFNLSLNHPADWKVTDTAGSNVLIIESPRIQLTDVQGEKAEGVIRLQIQNKNYPITGFENGNALATQQSELIKYTNPTQMQRAETHVSFLAYAPNTTGINALYITGDFGYQVNQAVPKLDIAAVEPIVSVQFLQCNDDACASPTALAISAAAWSDKAFADPIKSMLTSLSIN